MEVITPIEVISNPRLAVATIAGAVNVRLFLVK
jgi:hypothetical protein